MNYLHNNACAWDAIAEDISKDNKHRFTNSISHKDYIRAKNGALEVSLTSAKYVPSSWFPSLNGIKILGLACGGGQQGPVFAAHGADVTIMDISEKQIESEQFVADRESYSITALKSDMTQPFPFDDSTFDLIFNPVSNCYIEHIQPVWEECARVLKPGGLLMTGFIKEEHFMFDPDFQNEDILISKHHLPFNSLLDLSEEKKQKIIINHEPFVFSHTLTEQIGGIIKVGLSIDDIYEDGDGGGLFDKYMNSYVAVRATKKDIC